jgi:hypothetical protein
LVPKLQNSGGFGSGIPVKILKKRDKMRAQPARITSCSMSSAR